MDLGYRFDFPTGITQISTDPVLQLFPNPTTDILNVKTDLKNGDGIKIYDALGRIVLANPFSTQLDVSVLASGFYILELNFGQTQVLKQFVKL